MSDGTVLSANIAIPSTPGPHPTVMTITPYGKDGALGGGGIPECTTAIGNLQEAGYVTMLLDVRGTGASGGVYNLFGERERRDTAEVLDWIQAQPWSNGRVGVTGESAMGIATVGAATADMNRVAEGKPRAVHAIWADCPFPDLYRDAFLDSGGMGAQAILAAGSANVLAGHVLGYDPQDVSPGLTLGFFTQLVFNDYLVGLREDFNNDGDLMYFEDYFLERDVSRFAESIEIPVVVTAGQSDAINAQRGALYYFDHLTSSSKRVLLFSPGPHCAASNYEQLGFGSFEGLKVAWFDHWLKGVDNDIDDFPAFNMFPQNGHEWLQADRHPVPGTTWTPFYLDEGPSGTILSFNDGLLATSAGSLGNDALPYVPAHIPMVPPCTGIAECGPAIPGVETALTYTTEPLTEPLHFAGLITGQIFASFDRQEGTIALRLWDVAPDGTATVLTHGWLRGSLRAIDETRSDFGPGGQVIRPYHPLTRDSQVLTGGGTDAYLVELNPTSAVLPPGHRLRLSVSITDGTLEQSLSLNAATVGETMTVARGGSVNASNLLLPVITEPDSPGPPGQPGGPGTGGPKPKPPIPATGGGAALAGLALLAGILVTRRRWARS